MVKRLIGIPRDELQEDGLCIPPGHIWIEGDGNGEDSRKFGCVSAGLIKGKVLCKFSPVYIWYPRGNMDASIGTRTFRDFKENEADIRGNWEWRIKKKVSTEEVNEYAE
jgi:hypothetical protein